MGVQQIHLGMKNPSAIVTAEVTTCSRFDPAAEISEWFVQCNLCSSRRSASHCGACVGC